MYLAVQTSISPAERVLMLAEELPDTRADLCREAERVQSLLDSLEEAESEYGAELVSILEEVFLLQLEGIIGLLDYDEFGDEEQLEESLALLVESNRSLQELESALEHAREDMPLVA